MRFAPQRLLAEAINYIDSNQLDSADVKLNFLTSKYAGSDEAKEGRKLLAQLLLLKVQNEDLKAWELAETSGDISAVEKYIMSHPSGEYLMQANEKLRLLKIENEQHAYNNAIDQNSSVAWTKFIQDYPNREDIDEIRKKIIKAEIAEIRSNAGTGSLPSSYQTNHGYSENSSAKIVNNTSYVSVVRYSGPDISSFSIPAGGSRNVYLTSGNYQVAATAGNVSCAGAEDLHGNYTSSYSITTSTYRTRY